MHSPGQTGVPSRTPPFDALRQSVKGVILVESAALIGPFPAHLPERRDSNVVVVV